MTLPLRTAFLTAAGLFLAAPAWAQMGGHATCQPHGANEVRCAAQVQGNNPNIIGSFAWDAVRFTPPRGQSVQTGQATGWVSQCGHPGRQVGAVPVTNNGAQVTFPSGGSIGTLSIMQSAPPICVEVFVTRCGGSCQSGFLGGSQIAITLRR